jgi:hypothetical protein
MQDCPPIADLLMRHGPSPGLRLFARRLEIRELFARLRAPELPEDSFVQGASHGCRMHAACCCAVQCWTSRVRLRIIA